MVAWSVLLGWRLPGRCCLVWLPALTRRVRHSSCVRCPLFKPPRERIFGVSYAHGAGHLYGVAHDVGKVGVVFHLQHDGARSIGDEKPARVEEALGVSARPHASIEGDANVARPERECFAFIGYDDARA